MKLKLNSPILGIAERFYTSTATVHNIVITHIFSRRSRQPNARAALSDLKISGGRPPSTHSRPKPDHYSPMFAWLFKVLNVNSNLKKYFTLSKRHRITVLILWSFFPHITNTAWDITFKCLFTVSCQNK